MTPSLEQAFAEASKLSELQQNQLAQWLLDEILSEQKWDRLFTESEDLLTTLAEEALAEYQAGKTQLLDRVGCISQASCTFTN